MTPSEFDRSPLDLRQRLCLRSPSIPKQIDLQPRGEAPIAFHTDRDQSARGLPQRGRIPPFGHKHDAARFNVEIGKEGADFREVGGGVLNDEFELVGISRDKPVENVRL